MTHHGRRRIARPGIADLFGHRNVPLAMLTLMCAMGGIFVMGAMMPNYLTDYLQLSPGHGLRHFGHRLRRRIGQFAMPTVSDFIGRKLATLLSYILRGGVHLPVHPGRRPTTSPRCSGCCSSPRCSTSPRWRSSPGRSRPKRLRSAWSLRSPGLVIGAGEIFGGGVAPAIAGRIAGTSGIQNVFTFTIASLILGFVIALFLKETAPRKTGAV